MVTRHPPHLYQGSSVAPPEPVSELAYNVILSAAKNPCSLSQLDLYSIRTQVCVRPSNEIPR